MATVVSWVIHHTRGSAYGHIVVTDVFPEVYVILLDATFKNIGSKLMKYDFSSLHSQQE
jgi:hypothetical protein